MALHQQPLPSGRKVGVSFLGDPFGSRIVVLCLPTPSGGKFDPDPVLSDASELRVVVVDRPGYGASDPLGDDEEPSVELFADDVAVVVRRMLDEARELSGLDFGTIGAIGWSFGGAVALALAQRHPDLVDAVALVAVPAPSRLLSGERFSPVTELRGHGVERSVASLADSMADEIPDLDSLGIAVDDPEFESLGLRNRLERMLEESWVQGSLGVASDRFAVRSTSWTDGMSAVRADCLIVTGNRDPIVGSNDAQWYEHHLPEAERLDADGSHLVIASEWSRILDHVGTRRNGGERG